MKNKKEQAIRNQALSNELFAGKIYYDWVITTAFYSAIHFVEESLLPSKVNGQACKNISEVKRAYGQAGRHAARERLVFDKLPKIGPFYRWLDDQSRNSRYVSYKVDKEVAKKALEYLEKIKKACA